MAKQATYIIQGKQVNGAVIGAFAKRIGAIDDVLSVWANAATLQMVKHQNRNWLDSLFAMPALRLSGGDLSKAGKDVLSYIKAHCPNMVWNKDKKVITYSKPATTNILATHFVAAGVKEARDIKEGAVCTELQGRFYTPHGDFNLTFSEFKNIVTVKAPPKTDEPSMKASDFIKQVDKAISTFKVDRFIGTPEEILDAYTKAKELFDKIGAQLDKAAKDRQDKQDLQRTMDAAAAPSETPVSDMPLDLNAADNLLGTGRKGKSARTNGKGETVTNVNPDSPVSLELAEVI